MASSDEDEIFEKLRQKVDPEDQKLRDQKFNATLLSQQNKAQQRVAEAINANSTLPVTISSVSVLNATHTRRSFLQRVVEPLLSNNQERTYTLTEALGEIANTAGKLNRFDIFQRPIGVYIDQPNPTDPSTSPTDVSVFFSARERPRYTIRTGTEAGHAEGSAFANAVLRNVFGGAETLNASASLGTRTRSAYAASFETPVLSNPDLWWEIGGLRSFTLKNWASHEEVLKGVNTKLKWLTPGGHRHELGYTGMWRQITGLASNASPSVRADAGDTFKSSLSHVWMNDKRDTPMLPSRGYMVKTTTELAGFGPLSGDVAFGKVEAESQIALPVPVPGVKTESGITVTAGCRAGLLYPLSLYGSNEPLQSRVNDRFQLGGPTDVRGFRQSGLGPRDGNDAVGGDIYVAGGASILFPFPRVGKETPLRFQTFVNAGRLLALKQPKGEVTGNDGAVFANVKETIAELAGEIPSCAAGFGIVYAHPAARFELNFSLPLVLRKGELGRKGLSFGVGLSFL